MNKQDGPDGPTTLWTPSQKQIRDSNITRFVEFVNKKHGLKFKQYSELYNWSIEKVSDFWSAIWEYTGIIASRPYDKVVDDLVKFPGAKWFPGARLNFADNLLRHRDAKAALISRSERGDRSQLTHAELFSKVAGLARSMRRMGVRAGDRVVGYMSNIPEATVAMLATTSIGALWGCCGAEIGPGAALDRIGQITPKLLFAVDGYQYKGRTFDILSNVEKLSKVPSIEKTIIVRQEGTRTGRIPNSLDFDELVRQEKESDIRFEQLPADHPVYIMFSSGTTGKPKCMVQGAAGLLANQLKEIILHADLKNTDRVTYITSPSWMMWNWLMSCLATGASVVLYDGNPNHPDWKTMWRVVQDEKVTVFGCSASYINYLKSLGVRPGTVHDLSSLREISQTGSPLSSDGFEWVYREVKDDLHLNSISGGTDINGCFAGGVPILPVHAGELQAPGLGMKIKAYDENGNSVRDQMGELVCEAPAPSMPLYFWNDPQNERYKEAYFGYYQSVGKNVWRHGDFVVFHSNTGGITFYGRSDAVIKASGVRIGTSEIYNVVEKIPEIEDSLAIGQNWKDDQRIILFVKPVQNQHVTEALREKIRKALREEASPKHVPALILEVPDIPYTFNMKKVEVAVSNILNNRPVTNRAVLVNPESLDFYQKLQSSLQRD
ncbi:MAG TPA: acetoacetate--CoA ligase [Candidatus Bathyarchaeia archaeon]|nr:acetoacetate--CoA ligase [Candidatus Bathyarchaeia archaeon]